MPPTDTTPDPQASPTPTSGAAHADGAVVPSESEPATDALAIQQTTRQLEQTVSQTLAQVIDTLGWHEDGAAFETLDAALSFVAGVGCGCASTLGMPLDAGFDALAAPCKVQLQLDRRALQPLLDNLQQALIEESDTYAIRSVFRAGWACAYPALNGDTDSVAQAIIASLATETHASDARSLRRR